MAITTSIGFSPIWYLADKVGRPLGGGYLASYSSLDFTTLNPIYQDPEGLNAWPYVDIPNTDNIGIAFGLNGSQGPFYFKFDSDVPDKLYYLEAYDSNGVLQWTVDDFNPATGGGGSVITNVIDLENLIVNGEMYRNFGASANPIATLEFKIAQGCHSGLAETSPAGGYAGPDIAFLKNNLNAVDQLQFVNFPLGEYLPGDVTPVQYLNYTCSNSPAGETRKCVQFPITSKVKNLSNEAITFTIWARSTGSTPVLKIKLRQFFGNGGGSVDVNPTLDTLELSTSWTKHTIHTTIPSVIGKTLGSCGDDALFVQVEYPFGSVCNIDFIKPSNYLGNVAPQQDTMLNDQIDGVLNVPRTGDVRPYYGILPFGWLSLNGGTIGNPSSNATSRASIDTFPLFNLLWNNISNTYAPVFNSSGTPIARGVSAVADFIANNALHLPQTQGRALGSVNAPTGISPATNWVLGQFTGEEVHVLTIPEIPSHTHQYESAATVSSGSGAAGMGGGSGRTTGATGGGLAHNNMQPTFFTHLMIKL